MALAGGRTRAIAVVRSHSSPQRHLDGGYTVFPRILERMETSSTAPRQDDWLVSVSVTERPRAAPVR